MTKKRINIHIILANNSLKLETKFSFGIILTMGIYRYRIIHSPIYTNLQGIYEIELDSSYVYRSFDVYPYGFLVHIHKDNIRLPTFKRKNSDTQFTSQDLAILKNENNGSWKIISSNPDSIYIYANKHVLYGKYQVSFKTHKTGNLGYTTTDYMYLDNDSTHLCLTRVK